MPGGHDVVCPILSFYHPIKKGCVPCSEVCNSDQSNVYCINNCQGWCPEGSFLHPITNQCISCSALCEGEQGTEANREFCRRQCSDVLHGCKKTEQFYHPIEQRCVDCSRICTNKTTQRFCQNNCAQYLQDREETENAVVSSRTSTRSHGSQNVQLHVESSPSLLKDDGAVGVIPLTITIGLTLLIILAVIVFVIIYKRSNAKYSRTKKGKPIATDTQGQSDTSSEVIEGLGSVCEQDRSAQRQSLLSPSSAQEVGIQGVRDPRYQAPTYTDLGVDIRGSPIDASPDSNDVTYAEVHLPVSVCSPSQRISFSLTDPSSEVQQIPQCTQQTNMKVVH